MKKLPLLILFATVTVFSSFKKDDVLIKKPVVPTSYYPTASGTSRTFLTVTDGAESTFTEVFNGKTKVVNKATYYEAEIKFANSPVSSKAYYYHGNNVCRNRAFDASQNAVVELDYLNEKESVGYTWTSHMSPTGNINGVPEQVIGTIKEKGISKTINGKTYNDVIHTSMNVQYNVSNGYQTVATYDFYMAKGIGIILMDANIDSFGIKSTSRTELLSYNIKG